ncbi:PAS domain S-box-containing protein [Desulfatibacillum alkenivorans DSM 16219]|uniref:histidine kinase n=2 Tax=Desulfatibacillum alkenivorans TaxID=259354 RepID=A0A1M7B203_9BACT|nr:PAS domain S-box-containing protein [Desulfatibacillum alkenivorans DSM 16219]
MFMTPPKTSQANCCQLVLWAILCLSVFFPATAFAGNTDVEHGASIQSGCEVDYPPFSFVDSEGRPSGFSVELLRAALKSMGQDVTFRTGPWAEVRGWLEDGEVDALPLVGRTPEREPLFDFTFPYMSLHGAIVVRNGTKGIWEIEDLRGKAVAVMKGDNAEEFLRREDRGMEIHTTATFEEALRELSQGRYDAVVIQRLVALRIIQKSGLTNLHVVENPVKGFRQDFCFAVTEGDRETLALLNEGLAIVMADGTYRHLHAKWFASLELPTNRRIVVGGDHNFPPFEYLDEHGRQTGFNVDLTRAIAREMGLDIEIRLGPWAKIREDLARGEIDVIQGMFYSPERDLTFDFTSPHTVNQYVSVVRRGQDTPPGSLEELQGLRIAVQTGDIMHDHVLENDVQAEITALDAQEDALREVAEGRQDCALVSRLTALYWIKKYGWENLVLAKKPILTNEYCIAVPQDRKALLAQFGEGLKLLEETGEYRKIYQKWMGVYGPPLQSLRSMLKHMAYVAIPLLILLLGIFLWSRTLKRQVAKQTKDLREGTDKFRFVFESANVGKSLTRPDGEIRVNKAFADFLGYSREELAGKTWQEITPPEDIEQSQNMISPLLNGRQDSTRFHKRYIHKNGSFVWADVSVMMRRDENGKPMYFVTTVVDIDEQKKAQKALRESEEFQRAMIACSPVALYSIDMDGRVTSWNSSAERVFGWRADEILGEPLPIVPEESGDEFDGFRRQVMEDGGFVGKELIRQRKGGSRFPVSLSVAPIYDDSGETVGIMGAAQDISDRKAAEDALRESEARYSRTLDNMLEGCQIIGFDWKYLYVNDAAGRHGKKTREELLDRTMMEVYDVTKNRELFHVLQNCMETRTPQRMENEFFYPDGSSGYFELSIEPVPEGVFILSIDITKRRRAKAALEESEKKYRLLAENTLDVIWTMNLDLEFTYINPSIQQMTGHTVDEWVGSRLQDHCDEENFGIMAEVVAEEMAKGPHGSGVIFEADMLKKNGDPIPVEIHGKVIFDEHGEPMGLQGTTRDVSERKQSARRIRHLNQVLLAIRDINQLIVREKERDALIRKGSRLLVAHRGYPSALIVLVDPDEKPVFWAMAGSAEDSEELARIFQQGGLPACCKMAKSEKEVLVVSDQKTICGACPIFEECRESQSLCLPLIHDEQLFGYVAVAAEKGLTVDEDELSLFREMAEDFAYALSVMKTEEERQRRVEELRESEARFRMFADLAPVGIVISDDQENTLYVSPKFTQMFGYTKEDMPSVREWWELAYPAESLRNRVREEWAEAVERARKTRSDIKPMEYPVTCKDGSVRIIEFRMKSTGNMNVVVFTDNTEKREAEGEHEKILAQLSQAQKMESVGRLAGGVAHDYNNMLSVILGYGEMAMEKVPHGDPLENDLEEIVNAGKRSMEITRQLLAFARKQTVSPKVVSLNETVENMLKMLRNLIGEDIDLAWMPGEEMWPIRIDPSQVDQILANLCINARDAIAGVGKITIETENVVFDEEFCLVNPGFVPGEYVMLAVSDDGSGMDPETMDNVFEPFFTTKELGKGTGLGLSTVYGVVKQNEGFIKVYSEREKGSTFKIYLPRHRAKEEKKPVAAPAISAKRGHETILLVEDEHSILKMAATMLKNLGYQVLAASTPGEAINLAREHAGEIHLVMTDVVMPEMNGRDLAKNLMSLYPDMKRLFMSGYTANVIAHHGVLDEGVHFIQKPFSMKTLGEKVREALDEP